MLLFIDRNIGSNIAANQLTNLRLHGDADSLWACFSLSHFQVHANMGWARFANYHNLRRYNPVMSLLGRSQTVDRTSWRLLLVEVLILRGDEFVITFTVLFHFDLLDNFETLNNCVFDRVGGYLFLNLLHVLDVHNFVKNGFDNEFT